MVDRVKSGRVIPLTPIVRRYRNLPKSRKARLALANELVVDPAALVQDYAESVEQFADYDNVAEPFYGKRPTHDADPERIGRTIDLALRLQAMRAHGAHVDVQPTGERVAGDGPGVAPTPAAALGFDYVDRELVAARTTGGATFEDGSSATTALRLDLLLANHADRTPIIGEVKVKTDKDPFAALVQLLACAAHLATANQYERLRRHYPDASFVAADGSPTLDLYIVLVEFPAQATYLPELLTATERLARRLVAEPGIAATVRRIACLDVVPAANGVSALVRFAVEAQNLADDV